MPQGPFDDPTKFALTPDQVALGKVDAKPAKSRRRAPTDFYFGKLPLAYVRRAGRAGPLHLLLGLLCEARKKRGRTDAPAPVVAVTAALGLRVGFKSKNARLRALRCLESAGLVHVDWCANRAPRARLTWGVLDQA